VNKKLEIPITVTFRHLAPSDALRDHARKKLMAILGLVPGATDAHIILATASHHHRQSAEVVVHGASSHLSAHAETDDMYAAVDQAVAKLDRQVRKLKGRVIDGPRRGTVSDRRPPPAASSAGQE